MRGLGALDCFVIATLLALGACGKDKPPEMTGEAAPVIDESALSADTESDSGAPTVEGPAGDEAKTRADEAKTRMDPKLSADDPKSRIRGGRERPGRRPVPVRHLRDGDEGAEGGGEPVLAGEPTPTEPTPTPTPTEPTPTEPTPTEPTPTPMPEPTTAVEIRNDAAAIDAAALLPLVTVAEITTKTLAPGVPLQGIAIVAGYGSIFYAAADAAKFGVALQAWQDATRRESDDRFRRMRLQYPNGEDVSVLAPSKAFFSYFGTIQSLTWVEPAKRMVVSVTCAEAVCSHDQLVRLAKTARERM